MIIQPPANNGNSLFPLAGLPQPPAAAPQAPAGFQPFQGSPELQDRSQPGYAHLGALMEGLAPHEAPPSQEELQNPLRQGKSLKQQRADRAKDQEILDHVCGKGCGCQSAKKPAGVDPLKALAERDEEVRKHELDHYHEAGEFAASGPLYETTTGSDGRSYVTGGKVLVNVSEVDGDPEKTIAKMKKVESAALKPAEPSDQDRRVAAEAQTKRYKAERELADKRAKGDDSADPASRKTERTA